MNNKGYLLPYRKRKAYLDFLKNKSNSMSLESQWWVTDWAVTCNKLPLRMTSNSLSRRGWGKRGRSRKRHSDQPQAKTLKIHTVTLMFKSSGCLCMPCCQSLTEHSLGAGGGQSSAKIHTSSQELTASDSWPVALFPFSFHPERPLEMERIVTVWVALCLNGDITCKIFSYIALFKELF